MTIAHIVRKRIWQRAGRWGVLLVAAFALLGAACDTEGAEDAEQGVDRSEILNEVEEVRELFAETSTTDPLVIEESSFEDGVLTVQLSEVAQGADDAGRICDDLARGIEAPDVRIRVLGPDGSELASCQFRS